MAKSKNTILASLLTAAGDIAVSGSDVQAIWRKHGWTPPSEKMLPPPPEKYQEPLRRVR